jgi:hypothetical protein
MLRCRGQAEMRGLRIVMNRMCNIKRLPIDPGPKEPISTYQDASRRCCTQNRVRGTCDASSLPHMGEAEAGFTAYDPEVVMLF